MESGNTSRSRRLAILVEYDGTGFNGWQIQNGGRTVQGEFEKAIQILFKEKTRVVASGRTDSGVHALGQVVHFDTENDISLQRICIGLNGILPRDVSVKNAYQVPCGFHARFSTVERTYRYLIYNHPSRTPFMMNRAMWVHEKLDRDYMRAAAGFLVGEMDYSSFCKKREVRNVNPIRRIEKIDIRRDGELLTFDISGNAFLHNMVRIIVGTLVEMNKKNAGPQSILEIISKRDRDYSGATAPPYGLYLLKVEHEPRLAELDSAF
ncbi:MAG: tRNA pseudouridine(38-40) synthase TruA [Spirochaetes bacterium RBG_13_51_14]|nr:MAG: tRNA pseudouridine(38-40) synthase TruA [Spirochaetes bacterium RBG_13_51_14]